MDEIRRAVTARDAAERMGMTISRNGSEYVTLCPWHNDTNPSLTLYDDNGIGRCKCFACGNGGSSIDLVAQVERCSTTEASRKLADWFHLNVEIPEGKPGKRREKVEHPPELPGMTVHTTAPAVKEPKPAKVIDWDHPLAFYDYRDAAGELAYQVVRLKETTGDKVDKTFRQRSYWPDNKDPKVWKVSGMPGWVWAVSDESYNAAPIYRLPETVAAIRAGKPIYIVEGEKDVETMTRLGYPATTNSRGAGNWIDAGRALMAGADVIILPDSDPPMVNKKTGEISYKGQDSAWGLACDLLPIAKRVRLVDLKSACPDLPLKGDITDMVELMGEVDAMDALARQVAATRDFDPDGVKFWLSPAEQAAALYSRVQGYGIENGCIVQYQQNGTKALTDFYVIPRMELTKDDGLQQDLYFVLDGWNSQGHKLGRVTIVGKDLDSMNWVTGKWGFSASMAPGSTNKDKVAWCIKKVGQMTAKRVTEYNHSGWRRIGGKWCYLYHGGAVGMEGVTVDMGDALKSYRLDGSGAQGFDEIPYRMAAEKSLAIQSLMKEDIGIALLGTAYLAPLREFLTQTDVVPAFALFLHGESGTHKTTAATLALSHFGNFHGKNTPASFNDTPNQIQKKAFLAKDMLLLVDDFHPVSSLQEKRQMAAAAQRLSRAFGDSADRGRLNADRSIQANNPPRSVAMITGEDLPAIGASGTARFFIIDVDKGDIPVSKELTDMQEDARKGFLQRAMRGYITWLLDRADGLPDRLHELFLQYRDMIRRKSAGQHDRAPEAVACILIGYHMMLDYMCSLGMFDREEALQMLNRAAETLTETSRRQAAQMESEKPTRIFLDSMTELLASKSVVLADLTGGDPALFGNPKPGQDMAGYMDADYYYLLPNVAFGAVQRLCREQGVEFPVSLKALYKHLRTDGILPGLRSDENPTRNKWIDGRAVRLLWIPRRAMDGPPAAEQQVKMNLQQVDEEIPEEWQ